MGILQKARETYDAHSALAGVVEVGKSPLIPICHILQKAQIEITLDLDGNFVRAEEVDNDDTKTIIPATEASATRSGTKPRAHPLCDQVGYLSSQNKDKHGDYLNELSTWANSKFSHAKVQAVLKYIRKDTLLIDLKKAGLLKKNNVGKLEKIAGIDIEKCLVRWNVLNSGPKDQSWTDITLFDSFQNYILNQQLSGEKEFCMIEGIASTPAVNHPKGIVAAPKQNNAKLISANDESGFTYRGRFDKANQAVTVSYIASQKAHNALQWVAANQGVIIGGRTFICWNPQGRPVLQPLNPLFADTEPTVTPSAYKKQVYKAISGFKNDLPEHEGVVIASFDAATTGRLALTYYNELISSDFLSRVENWYNTCYWGNEKFGFNSPSIRDIAKCAFGTQHGQFLELDDRVLREQAQRLLTCVVDGAPIPFDIVKALAQRASSPMAYDKSQRGIVLSTACAVMRKYYNDKEQKEVWTVALDPQKKDVSYQYGRLLAVMEKVERDTYDKEESREPNAIRMQSVFAERPVYATRIILESLNPYFARLTPSTRAYYKKLISEIMEIISELNSETMRRLDDTYLMGYYLQRNEFYKPKSAEMEDN